MAQIITEQVKAQLNAMDVEEMSGWLMQVEQQRPVQIVEEKEKTGGKIISYFCVLQPVELLRAAGVMYPFTAANFGEKDLPTGEIYLRRNYCPIPKAMLGLVAGKENPFVNATDAFITGTSCDSRAKAWEHMEKFVPMLVYEVPRKFDTPEQKNYAKSEMVRLRKMIENFIGHAISDESIREAIKIHNKLRTLQFELCKLRGNIPAPIQSTDAFFAATCDFMFDVEDSITFLTILNEKLKKRVQNNKGFSGPRILIAGSPICWPTVKLHSIIMECGAVVVGDENCTQGRRFGVFTDPNHVDENNADVMMALTDTYMHIPCGVWTPDADRLTLISNMVKELKVDGVIYHNLEHCHVFGAEFHKVKILLNSMNIPVLPIDHTFGESDREQIKIRIQGLMEILRSKRPV